MSSFSKDDFKKLVDEYRELTLLGNSPSASAKKRELMTRLESHEDFKNIFKVNIIGVPKANHKKPPSQGPKLIVMVGGPGSGKTNIRNRCLDTLTQDTAIILNPDYIFTELFDNDNQYRGTLNELFRIFYQKYLGNQDSHIASCKNIVLDRTGAYTEATEYIVKSLKSFSEHNCAYEVILCVADVDVNTAYERTIRRSSPDGEEPGRVVPRDVVYRTHQAVDTALDSYVDNTPIQLFSSIQNAKDNIGKISSTQYGFSDQNTKTAYIDNGNLVIHTNDYGFITIPEGNWTFDGVMEGKPITGQFGVPISVNSITTPVTSNSTIEVTMGNGDVLKFKNNYRLYDKIYIYDNNEETPKLVYSQEYGKIKNKWSDSNNPYSILSPGYGSAEMPSSKGGKRKKIKKRTKKKKKRTRSCKVRNKRKKNRTIRLKKRHYKKGTISVR